MAYILYSYIYIYTLYRAKHHLGTLPCTGLGHMLLVECQIECRNSRFKKTTLGI